MKKKVFVMVPNLRLPGGVANFYRVAQKYFSSNVFYINISSSVRIPFIKSIVNGFLLLKNVLKIYLTKDAIVVLNPSLTRAAYWRDGIVAIAARVTRKRVFIFWRGWDPSNESLFKHKVTAFFFRCSFLKAHKHIVLNQYVESKLIFLGINPEVILKSNTIVDDSYFEDAKVERDKKKVLLFLARVEKYKGIYETIEVFRNLKNDPMLELHIAGSGSELSNVKKYVEAQNITNVHFLGYLTGKKKIEACQNAYCYIFPSYSEGMPNSVLEAMACSLPIICTKVGAINDFFEDEKMGYSFNLPVAIDDLTRACNHLIDNVNLRNQIGAFNMDYAKMNFKASQTIERLEQVFYE